MSFSNLLLYVSIDPITATSGWSCKLEMVVVYILIRFIIVNNNNNNNNNSNDVFMIISHKHWFHSGRTRLYNLIAWIQTWSALWERSQKDGLIILPQFVLSVYSLIQSNDIVSEHMVRNQKCIRPFQRICSSVSMACPLQYPDWQIVNPMHN